MEKEYKVIDGVHFNVRTPEDICRIIVVAKNRDLRLRFHWGDVETGQDWGDTYDVEGRVGLSTGPIKIPILLNNRRSRGGGAILDHCIVKITESAGKRVLYQHPNYQPSKTK